MDTAPVAYPRPRVRTQVDHASLTLLRAVMADGWRPERAAHEMLARVHGDRRVLRLLRARVARALLERPTRIKERAAATLDLALATPTPPRTTLVPRQGGAHA